MKTQKWSSSVHFLFVLALLVNLVGFSTPQAAQAKPLALVTTPYPILFVTQLPIRPDFTTIGSVFGNHLPSMQSVGRGGDLYIRYPNGTLKNLTLVAGKGSNNPDGFQDDNAIAVRDPSVHWDGTKALFSMVVGAPEEQYDYEDYYWQIYEITGLGQADTPVITKVLNQPATFNNVSPIYGTDDRIIFTSDRPRNGAMHLYPQLDEYEEAPTVTGIWSLDPATGDLLMINHAPSGDFTPILDSFGRVLFTQWDHLQRDQQADSDKFGGNNSYGTFNWSSEAANSVALSDRTEIFPEPRAAPEAPADLNTHTFNQFLPWQIHEDGHEAETINHIGRHELNGYIPQSFNNDPNLQEYYGQVNRFNENEIENFLQIKEDPLNPGRYFGVDAPEFSTHASGQVIRMDAPPTLDADHIAITYVTHRDTASYTDNPESTHSGHYRDPLPLSSSGMLIAAHTNETDDEADSGPSIYDFRLKSLALSGNGYYVAGETLTSGISKTIRYWDPDYDITYIGNLWELQPVEVRARTRPARLSASLGSPEQQVFTQAGVDVAAFQAYMREKDIALIVSHNVTTRDDFDFQQPFNLRIPGGVQTLGAGGKIYDIKHMQLFQADQLRGLQGPATPADGRRVLAQFMHDPNALAVQPPNPTGPASSVALGLDGSMAAFVPARRAMTWQLTNPSGVGVVRERFWLTFQPGEIRVCGSCHGVNEDDQAGNPPPVNQPQALMNLLQHWKTVINTQTVTVPSLSAGDGWVLENSENGNKGGSINNAAVTFNLGDDAARKQYRGILSFNTGAALPDGATITAVTLRVRRQGITGGGNPLTAFQGFMVDIKKGLFGTAALQAADFQAAASKSYGPFSPALASSWYSINLTTGKAYINKLSTASGLTQIRLRFKLDDNNNAVANILKLYSANSTPANRPQLVINYYE